MKSSTTIAIVLVIVFAIAGLGTGYVMGGSGAAAHTTTVTTSTTATVTTATTATIATTNTGAIVNYWNEASASSYGEGWYYITRTTLVSLLNANNGSTYVLDVRLAGDYNAGHIASAINIPFPNMSAAVAAGQIPNNKLIVVICYVGESAASTMTALRLLGYNAYDLEGGMAAWNNATRVTFEPNAQGQNYPMVTGTSPGVWTPFTPTAAGNVP